MAKSRRTIFDYLEEGDEGLNKFCDLEAISNESGVELFLIGRLLKDLHYKDIDIKPKESLESIVVSKGGRKKEYYKPDFVAFKGNKPRMVLEAKGPNENLDSWIYQPRGYAVALNGKFKGENPVSYFCLCNGLEFRLYKWDEDESILTLTFEDFVDGNASYENLKNHLSWENVVKRSESENTEQTVEFRRPEMIEVKAVFRKCHNIIWKAEKMGPSPAFFEFVKIMLVKLWEDRRLHNDPMIAPLIKDKKSIPSSSVKFSVAWLDEMQKNTENPFDSLLFQHLLSKFNESVERRDKKRIFEKEEGLMLNPGTIRSVVAELEHLDMYGIDEDLNGRLFEAFLSATMRGRELGQFFTPRSIVKLIANMADLEVSRKHIDMVLDGCCGTGGFLIEALTIMRNKVRANTTLSEPEAKELLKKIADESIFGIDAGKDPPVGRIARINMYLHGDGGSKIYVTDSLDKTVSTLIMDTPEIKMDTEELAHLLTEKKLQFDVVLTNPPFSMDYSRNLPNEARILKQYELSRYGYKGKAQGRESLRSSVMFLERYYDLLKPGKRILTVIDDSVLSSPSYSYAREYIREKFVVRAVISLHGDAFQRSGARAKTSILYLSKRMEGDTSQPDIFMAESVYIGLDDVPQKTPPSVAAEAKRMADNEADDILRRFNDFLKGGAMENRVSASRIVDRLDVKACLPRKESTLPDWYANESKVLTLDHVVELIEDEVSRDDLDESEKIQFLMVSYDGTTQKGEERLVSEVTYDKLYRAKDGDIVLSNIAAVLGSTGIVTGDLTETLASSEFTILRVKDPRFTSHYVAAFLRSPEARALMISKSSGISRHRISWEILKSLAIPILKDTISSDLEKKLKDAEEMERKAKELKGEVISDLYLSLQLDNDWAKKRLIAAKPPK